MSHTQAGDLDCSQPLPLRAPGERTRRQELSLSLAEQTSWDTTKLTASHPRARRVPSSAAPDTKLPPVFKALPKRVPTTGPARVHQKPKEGRGHDRPALQGAARGQLLKRHCSGRCFGRTPWRNSCRRLWTRKDSAGSGNKRPSRGQREEVAGSCSSRSGGPQPLQAGLPFSP